MSSDLPKNPDENNPSPGNEPGKAFTQELHHSQISARVPEKVGRGVFSTGLLVMQGPHEFTIDFLLRMAQPHQICARVVISPAIMPNFINALRENFNNYQSKFGQPPALPSPPPTAPPPSIEEIYDNLKLPDDLLSGVYANGVMIAHTASEFCFDFLTNFYPRSAVSCRVYLSAPQIPGVLNTLTRSLQQYQQQTGARRQPKPDDLGPNTSPNQE